MKIPTHSFSINLAGDIFQVIMYASPGLNGDPIKPSAEFYMTHEGKTLPIGEVTLKEYPSVDKQFKEFINTTLKSFPYAA